MAIVVSYKNRMQEIVKAIKPFADLSGFSMEYSGQKINKIRDSSKPLMYVGFGNPSMISYQTYEGEYNTDTEQFDMLARYVSLVPVFIDFYTFDYDFIDVSRETGIILNSTDFSLFNMTASFFDVVSNTSQPDMIQSQLKQSSKLIISFMMTDEISLPPIYKADKISLTGSISGLNLSIEVNLDG